METESNLKQKDGNGVILVAVDNSEYAELVSKEASSIASQKGSDVVILSVVSVPSLAEEGEIDGASIEQEEREYEKLHRMLIDKYFSDSSSRLVESKILHGDAADKIVKYADQINADMIVLGTRGRGRIATALLGSVSSKVAHHSKRSVFIVKDSKPR